MTPQTISKATEMLARILEQGATYTAVGASYGLARSTVERTTKALGVPPASMHDLMPRTG